MTVLTDGEIDFLKAFLYEHDLKKAREESNTNIFEYNILMMKLRSELKSRLTPKKRQ